ncbi:MAG: hypothetical protein NC401_19060 [Ruminococcus sp.]|nr:hypothetical protein [Ruminococcus sp.]
METAAVIELLLIGLEWAIEYAVQYAIEYTIRKIIDETGRAVTQIVYLFDSDGDGINDSEEVLYSFDMMIPDLDGGLCLCNDGDEIGLGMPQYKILDGFEIGDWLDTEIITGNDDGFIVDYDFDGDVDDVIVPFGFDFNGDGQDDWGLIIDDDDNGVPDASPDAPFYPVGSPKYRDIIQRSQEQSSIIVVSGDGCMTVYDMNGNITAEECDTAYSLWVSQNGIMNKPIAEYSVTEGILLCAFIVGFFKLASKIFRRRRVNKHV